MSVPPVIHIFGGNLASLFESLSDSSNLEGEEHQDFWESDLYELSLVETFTKMNDRDFVVGDIVMLKECFKKLTRIPYGLVIGFTDVNTRAKELGVQTGEEADMMLAHFGPEASSFNLSQIPSRRFQKATDSVLRVNQPKLKLLSSLSALYLKEEAPFNVGDIVVWKPSLKNRKKPMYGQKMIVVGPHKQEEDKTNVEQDDIILGMLDENFQAIQFPFNSKRFTRPTVSDS